MTQPEESPPTRPAFLTHPSWEATRGAHAAPDSVDEEEVYPQGEIPPPPPVVRPKFSSTAVVLIVAMVLVTVVVLLVSLLGDPRGGAMVSVVAIVVGALFAFIFRDRWR